MTAEGEEEVGGLHGACCKIVVSRRRTASFHRMARELARPCAVRHMHTHMHP